MSRATRNLCFLITVTIVNVFIYMAMSGNLLVFRKTPSPDKEVAHRLDRDAYQGKISQFVKEAIRDHGITKHNLTAMLERALKDQGYEEGSTERDSFMHVGKVDAANHSPDKDVKNLTPVVDHPDQPKLVIKVNPVETNVEEIMRTDGEREKVKEEVKEKEPAPQTTNQHLGVLDRLSNLFAGGKSDKTIVNPHDYNLVLNEPNKCKSSDGEDKPVFLLVLISTIHKNFDQRNAIRRTWGSPTEIDGNPVITMFLLAKNTNPQHQRLVEQESNQYHDLLMEDFLDTYKNLTLKTMMGMKWATLFCPQAKFVMKTDDDMYVSYANLVKHLAKPITPTNNFVTGFVINGGPIRDPKSKWFMPRETYPGSKYPPFCSGTGYVMSGDVTGKVYAISLYTPFLYLEDVYFAVCMDKLHIVPVNHKEFNNWRTAYSYCRFKRIFTTHMVTVTEMHRIWSDQKTTKSYHCYA